MLVRALQQELERNLELARTTKKLLHRERDMLQGEVRERLVFYRFHTDVWDAYVNGGRLGEIRSDQVVDAYTRIKEVNELIDSFNANGNRIVHTPLMENTIEGYGRKDLIGIIEQKCAEMEHRLATAYRAVSKHANTICPACGAEFANPRGLKSHITQKSDEAHADLAIDL